MSKIIVIAHDMRSTHNVGSLLRTADGLGITSVYFTGYTPYPAHEKDTRLPHIARKLDAQIHKTALGAEKSVEWKHLESLKDALYELKSDGYRIVALEQDAKSIPLSSYERNDQKIGLVLGNERDGLNADSLALVDDIIEIPMLGNKESLNVVQAAAIALYTLIHYA